MLGLVVAVALCLRWDMAGLVAGMVEVLGIAGGMFVVVGMGLEDSMIVEVENTLVVDRKRCVAVVAAVVDRAADMGMCLREALACTWPLYGMGFDLFLRRL